MMFIHTWQQVMDGSKTITSRLQKPGEFLHTGVMNIETVFTKNGQHPKWQVGKSYAVQPARTAKAIGRIQITAIRAYDVRDITADEARREGFQDIGDFWFTWVSMHDKSWLETYRYAHDCDYLHEYGFYKRPEKHYSAWQLTFRLVTE